MQERKADIILHPVRLRILQKFLGGEERTAKELAKLLPDIAQATLYRQLDTLVKANLLLIIEERQIRGTLEKIYTLNMKEANLSPEDLSDTSKEEHMKYFMFFTTQLWAQFDSYLEKDQIDLEKDGVVYRQAAIYLSDDEFKEFAVEYGQMLQKVFMNKPNSKRKKRILSTIVIPDEDEGGKENG